MFNAGSLRLALRLCLTLRLSLCLRLRLSLSLRMRYELRRDECAAHDEHENAHAYKQTRGNRAFII